MGCKRKMILRLIGGGIAFFLLLLVLFQVPMLLPSSKEDPGYTELSMLMPVLLANWEACVSAEERASFCEQLPQRIQHMESPWSWRTLNYKLVERDYNVLIESESASQTWSVLFLRRGRKPGPGAIVSSEGAVYQGAPRVPGDMNTLQVFAKVRSEIARGEWFPWDGYEAMARHARRLFVKPTLERVTGFRSGDETTEIRLSIHNGLETEIALPSRPGGGAPVPYDVRSASGVSVPMKVEAVPEGAPVRLAPGEDWSGTIVLSDYFSFSAPGEYRCRIVLLVTFTNDAGKTFRWEIQAETTRLRSSPFAPRR